MAQSNTPRRPAMLDAARAEPIVGDEDPASLEAHAVSEVHIAVEDGFADAAEINPLKDFLFGKSGQCFVYFHIDTGKGPYIVKANSQLTVPSDSALIAELKELPFVKDVWTA